MRGNKGVEMNKRIRLLAQEAGMYVDLNGAPWPRCMSAEECELAYAKFADMIVRECADIATMNQFQWDSAGGYVLKHFGVDK